MQSIIRSSFAFSAIALALGAVACSQGPGEDAVAGSSEAALTIGCANWASVVAPASGTVHYNAVGAQYANDVCHAYVIDVTGNSYVHLNAALANNAITAAECPNVYAQLQLLAITSNVTDCGDVPPPKCKPHVYVTQNVIAQKTVHAAMVSTPSGPRCELPSTAVIDATYSAGNADSVKLFASAPGGTTDANLALTLTTR